MLFLRQCRSLPSSFQDTKNDQWEDIDDLAPRANIRKLFKDGSISSSNCEKLRTFSEEFCVEEKHVVSYVKHLEQLATVASIRERERRLNRTIEEGKQYLKEHQLPTAGKKPDKLKRITADFYLRNDKEVTSEDKPADPESDSVWESDSDEDSTVEPLETTETETCQFSRSGRRVGSWMSRYHENYV